MLHGDFNSRGTRWCCFICSHLPVSHSLAVPLTFNLQQAQGVLPSVKKVYLRQAAAVKASAHAPCELWLRLQ